MMMIIIYAQYIEQYDRILLLSSALCPIHVNRMNITEIFSSYMHTYIKNQKQGKDKIFLTLNDRLSSKNIHLFVCISVCMYK